jgi:hypothetical protein
MYEKIISDGFAGQRLGLLAEPVAPSPVKE